MPRKRPSTRQQAGSSPGLMLGPNNLLDGSIADAIEIQAVPPGFPDDARAELGISLDSYLFKLTLDFKIVPDAPLDWQGYTWELVGAFPLPETTFERYRFRLPVFAGHGAPDSAIVVWRRRVSCKGTPIYLEARWTPTTGETLALHGLEKDPRKKSIDRAYRGIKLLKAIEAVGGRPPDIGDEATFRQLCSEAYRKVLDEKRRDGGKLPNKTEVAAEMLMHRKTLTRNLFRYKLSFPPY